MIASAQHIANNYLNITIFLLQLSVFHLMFKNYQPAKDLIMKITHNTLCLKTNIDEHKLYV